MSSRLVAMKNRSNENAGLDNDGRVLPSPAIREKQRRSFTYCKLFKCFKFPVELCSS